MDRSQPTLKISRPNPCTNAPASTMARVPGPRDVLSAIAAGKQAVSARNQVPTYNARFGRHLNVTRPPPTKPAIIDDRAHPQAGRPSEPPTTIGPSTPWAPP